MIKLIRTVACDPNFSKLVMLLDAELAERDGDEHSFYQQFNHIESLGHVVLILENEKVIGCGAIKELDKDTMEVKRMFVLKDKRGRGLAVSVLSELERWASELGYTSCKLETGKRQPEAIALYQRSGYKRILNYGQYAGVDNSICFEKKLRLDET